MYQHTVLKSPTMDKDVKNVKRLNIYTTIIPIFYLSKLVGLAPFSLVCSRDKVIRVYMSLKLSVLGTLYTVLLILLIIGAQCCALTFQYKLHVKVETINVYLTEQIISVISSITSLAVTLTKIRKEMNKLLNKVSVLDELFHIPNEVLKRNENFLRIQIISLISIVCIIYLNDILFLESVSGMWTSFFITVYVCTFIHLVTTAQFVNLILLLKQKFQILNGYIAPGENSSEHEANSNLWETVLQTSCLQHVNSVEDEVLRMDKFYQALTRRSYNNMLHFSGISNQNCWLHKERLRFRALRVIQDVLCDMCTSVNSMYGLQILLCIVSAFVEITTNMSYIIVSINVKYVSYAQFLHHVMSAMLWALMHFFLLFCVTGSCNAASAEANRSAVLLQKVLLTDLHPSTAAEVQLFLQQVSNRKVRFTAWDFFTINYTILGSIVGAITTLLVILVPFQITN
jgi:gustatory receptor